MVRLGARAVGGIGVLVRADPVVIRAEQIHTIQYSHRVALVCSSDVTATGV
jgi:hypothetical protein